MTTATQPPPADTSHLPTLAAVLPLLEGITKHKSGFYAHLTYVDHEVQRVVFRDLRDRFPDSSLSLETHSTPRDVLLRIETREATVSVRFAGDAIGESRACTHVTTCYVVDGVEIA